MLSQAICVFSSSSDAVAPAYFKAACDLGQLIALHGHTLVYGGSNVGLMGELARAVHTQQGKVIGVIPESIQARGVAYDLADELLVTADLRERKAVMEARSDAFIALPGGFGTLEEVSEILTLKQLQMHTKPMVLVNTLGFYDKLLALYEHFYAEHFAKEQYRKLYYVAPNVTSALVYIETYQPPHLESKWF
jgi:cytokinin riboside 5'-monophosphate phosphoribohydrolase